MTHDLLDLTATPERLRALAKAGVLTPTELERTLALSVATPGRSAWRDFLSAVLLGLGSLLVLSGVVYFFAYNWAELHHFAKLGLLLAAIIASCVAAWRLGEGLAGQFALLFAAVLVGPLLAVYGQAYQTGADPYELFLGWSLLVLPWVALARFAPLWLWLLLLVNTGIGLYMDETTKHEGTTLMLIIALINAGAWGAYEGFSARGVSWLRGRWMPRVLAVMTMAPLTGLSELVMLQSSDLDAACYVALVLLLGVMAAVYVFHRRVHPELFFLTLNALTVMTLVATLSGKILFSEFKFEEGSFFLMALVIVVEVGLSVWWLRSEARSVRGVES